MSELLDSVSWKGVFSADPDVSVAVVTPDGTIEYCNDASCDMFGVDGPAERWIGKKLSDVFNAEFVKERLAWIDRVTTSNSPLRAHQIHRGKHLISSYYPITSESTKGVLVITIEDGDRDSPSVPDVHSEYIDLGELAPLSQRELEVFILLGHGNSVPQVAKLLHRSPRTIERHKTEIGRKIGAASLTAITRIVCQSGLTHDHVGLKRFNALSKQSETSTAKRKQS